jgi:hypothetical protein
VLGSLTNVSMSKDGVVCKQCLAFSEDKAYQLRLEQGTRLSSSEGVLPRYIELQVATKSYPGPADGTIVSPIVEINAYRTSHDTTPLHMVFEPDVELALPYDSDKLPGDASEVTIVYYDSTSGWSPVQGAGGPADVGTARGKIGHFTPFAVIAKASATPVQAAGIVLSGLTVSPVSSTLNEPIVISVMAVNSGDDAGEYTVNLAIDGKSKGSQNVTLGPTESKAVTFTVAADTAGVHRVQVNQLSGQYETVAKKESGAGWIIWLIIILVVLFCVWRFRRVWLRLLR